MYNPSPELRAALEAAQAAGEIIRSLYQRNVRVQTKADRSPVTEADVRAEEAIRGILSQRFPGHGFYGEETGQHDLGAESVWLVDPLDGTKSFIRDCPFFSTQIALMRGGRLVLGVSSAPAYGELAWAEEGAGAYLSAGASLAVRSGGGAAVAGGATAVGGDATPIRETVAPIRVSATASLDAAIVSTGNLKTLARSGEGWRRFGELIPRVSRIRGYGDFVHYHLLARGSLDVVIESDVNILDIAALTVIVREAGGTFTDLQGGPVGLGTTSVLATNGALHETVRALLG
ncbi:MAG: inositol monophosphatase family protein [Steroidobacteraceae bacterium]